MATPLLYLLGGSNGAGKSTLASLVLVPATGFEFVNADLMAESLWPGDRAKQQSSAAVVSQLAADRRDELIGQRRSFITETVFSHESKVDLVRHARRSGYLVKLHAVIIPEGLAVARVLDRVAAGGHRVPEAKIRARYRRLWPLVAQATLIADETVFYDNSSRETPLREVARFDRGQLVGMPNWPSWAPAELVGLGTSKETP